MHSPRPQFEHGGAPYELKLKEKVVSAVVCALAVIASIIAMHFFNGTDHKPLHNHAMTKLRQNPHIPASNSGFRQTHGGNHVGLHDDIYFELDTDRTYGVNAEELALDRSLQGLSSEPQVLSAILKKFDANNDTVINYGQEYDEFVWSQCHEFDLNLDGGIETVEIFATLGDQGRNITWNAAEALLSGSDVNADWRVDDWECQLFLDNVRHMYICGILDANYDGGIDDWEIKPFLVGQNGTETEEALDSMSKEAIADADVNANGHMDYDECFELPNVSKFLQNTYAFSHICGVKDADYNEGLDHEEVRSFAKKSGDPVSNTRIKAWFLDADMDADGLIQKFECNKLAEVSGRSEFHVADDSEA